MNPTIVADFLAECQEDYVGLWTLVWRSRQAFAEANDEWRREQILDQIHKLLLQKTIIAGSFVDKERFVPWSEPPDVATEKIRRQWLGLGRDPEIGEIVWFTAPRS